MNFSEIMTVTRSVSSPTAFDDDECYLYYIVLAGLKPGANVIEVGLQYGRSSSIALQMARENGLNYRGIDNFEGHDDVFSEWIRMARSIMHYGGYGIFVMNSNDYIVGSPIDVILIDGDHSYEGVKKDCEHFLSHVKPGGCALFHDYKRESLPGVTDAVDEYMTAHQDEWMFVDISGTLAVWVRRDGIQERDPDQRRAWPLVRR